MAIKITEANIMELIQGNTNGSSTSLTLPISYDNKTLLKSFAWYEAIRNEAIPEPTELIWIDEFKRLGYSQKQILERIKKTAHKKIYGVTKFSDFLEEDTDFLTQEDVNEAVRQRFNNLCDLFGVKPGEIGEIQSLKYTSEVWIESEREKLNGKLKDVEDLQEKYREKFTAVENLLKTKKCELYKFIELELKQCEKEIKNFPGLDVKIIEQAVERFLNKIK